ncbi:hypothetical protein ACFU6S_14220 [Streptomyces sp. NPDC057456]|uniref:hypothetical protein n=1 Tax=Streptomyces sp. NPDC057456 TaxID=3346139 RepID=UPI0036886FCF
MPHALVITVCIVTAAVLAPPDVGIRDVLALLARAGGIGATIVVVVMTGCRGTGVLAVSGLIRRWLLRRRVCKVRFEDQGDVFSRQAPLKFCLLSPIYPYSDRISLSAREVSAQRQGKDSHRAAEGASV